MRMTFLKQLLEHVHQTSCLAPQCPCSAPSPVLTASQNATSWGHSCWSSLTRACGWSSGQTVKQLGAVVQSMDGRVAHSSLWVPPPLFFRTSYLTIVIRGLHLQDVVRRIKWVYIYKVPWYIGRAMEMFVKEKEFSGLSSSLLPQWIYTCRILNPFWRAFFPLVNLYLPSSLSVPLWSLSALLCSTSY